MSKIVKKIKEVNPFFKSYIVIALNCDVQNYQNYKKLNPFLHLILL